MRPEFLFCTVLALLFPMGRAVAQNPADSSTKRPIPAAKTTTPPSIDGDVSDAGWKSAPKAETFYDRQLGGSGIDQTTAWILYDDNYIYVAFQCKDSQADRIVARETIRDNKYANSGFGGDSGGSEDNVEVILDPFLSRNFNDLTFFSVNAIGTRSARLGGGRANKAEWKGDWDAAAKRVSDGWTAEMRIPWGILNYPQSRAPTTFGINFNRFQDRTKIQSTWSNTGPQRFLDLMGLWTGVQVPAGSFRPSLSLLPYLLPGINRSDPTLRSGIDARYSVTPELTGVGSLNPDFATIEGAIEGIQFSRSERFVPERRPFFLEGEQYLRAGQFFSVGRFFYSRRIKSFDTGLKVYGKVTPVDTIGILNATDIGNSNDLAARYRHDLSATASVGAFVTQHAAKDDFNHVAVLDQNSRWGKFSVGSEWAFSGGRDSGGGARSMSFSYEDKLRFWFLQLVEVAPAFRDANGLIGFTDYRGITVFSEGGAEWRNGFWRRWRLGIFPEYLWHTDGRPFRRGGGVDISIDTRSDWRFGIQANHQKFDEQTDSTIGFRIRRGVSNRFKQWGIQALAGKQADRPYSFIGPEFSYRIFRRLDLAYGGAVQNFEGREQQHILTVNYELSPTRSFGGRIVVQNADTNWYLSYRHSGEKGTEMFFIIGDPNAVRFREQAAVKMVFAL